jgi:aerobic C4-dicarboxylate transport protein
MSEARALTNFTGNAVATVLIGTWTKEIDKEQVNAVLNRERPFDESTMDDGHAEPTAPAAEPELETTATR